MEKQLINRRSILKKILIGAGALASTKILANTQSCEVSPEQTEGPFYPINFKLDQDNDLTYIKDHKEKALGEVVFISGIISDDLCRPIKGAIIEIWQVCASGKYSHPSDPNPAKLDPHFQYYGRAQSDENGRYQFKTIIPGEYKATESWIRPPHIHVKVNLRGYKELTTQMYFKGNKFNQGDRILQSLSKAEQKLVVIEFNKEISGNNEGVFNLSLPSF